MKKLLLFFAAASMTLAAYSQNNENSGFDYDPKIIAGTWTVANIVSGTGEDQPWPHEKTSVTFFENGNISGTGYFGSGFGTYKLSGKSIVCYVDGYEYVRANVVRFSDNNKTCVLDLMLGGTILRIKCKKS